MRWFKKKKVEIVAETIKEPQIDLFAEYFFPLGKVSKPGKRHSGNGNHLLGVGRALHDIYKACDIAKCVRPSAYTVGMWGTLDVDIPGAKPTTLKNTDLLPTYHEYQICDRCYDTKVRGTHGIVMVIGFDRVYDPDYHKQTQAKLEKKPRAKKRPKDV